MPAPTKDEKIPEGPRSFTRMLEKIAEGACVTACAKEQHELIKYLHKQACNKGATGKATGALILQLNYHVEARGICVVSHKIGTKEPEPERPADVFWLTEGKNLSKQPPKQPDLPFEVVHNPETGEVPDDESEVIEA